MKWEYLGKQEARTPPGMFGYQGGMDFDLWRSRVPGGWFLCTRSHNGGTGASSDLVFYPDPEHLWTGNEDLLTDAEVLLRPAGIVPPPAPSLPPAPDKLEPGNEKRE